MSDYHLHLHHHGPYAGLGPEPGVYPPGHIDSYVDRAIELGEDRVCFTEHLYRCAESGPILGKFWDDEPRRDLAEQTERFVTEDRTLRLESYVEAVVDARDRGLPVLLGLEVDFFPETIDAVLDLIAPYPWDLLIGSVHWIGGWSLDHPEVVAEFGERGVRRAYEEYFSLEAELAVSGSVDVLAHVDLIKVFGHRLESPPVDLYRPVVEGAVASGTAVEINTSGLRGLAGELYPGPTLLEMFSTAGVPITLASDAHSPEGVGADFDRARQAARSVGYTTRLDFAGRVGEPVAL